jgi:hypothetical protein
MNSIVVSLVVFVILMGGAFLGALTRRRLDSRHLDEQSRDVIRLGTGLLGTLAALVLGLLIASAKNSFDAQSAQIRQITSDVMQLDLILAQYGADAREAREQLRDTVGPLVERIWRENGSAPGVRETFKTTSAGENTFLSIQRLAPQTELQRWLKSQALTATTDLVSARTLLFAQSGNSIPTAFLVVLVFWLTIIFMTFSLFARLNPTVLAVLATLALSVSGALFLILSLNQSFSGPLQISSAPLRNALAPLAP